MPTHSPSFATKLPAYRIVPFSISPRHLTCTRAPELMLWKKTMDLLSTFCFPWIRLFFTSVCKNPYSTDLEEPQTNPVGGRTSHILSNNLIGLHLKNKRIWPIKSDVIFRSCCYGKPTNLSDGPYISNTTDILNSNKLHDKSRLEFAVIKLLWLYLSCQAKFLIER